MQSAKCAIFYLELAPALLYNTGHTHPYTIWIYIYITVVYSYILYGYILYNILKKKNKYIYIGYSLYIHTYMHSIHANYLFSVGGFSAFYFNIAVEF